MRYREQNLQLLLVRAAELARFAGKILRYNGFDLTHLNLNKSNVDQYMHMAVFYVYRVKWGLLKVPFKSRLM